MRVEKWRETVGRVSNGALSGVRTAVQSDFLDRPVRRNQSTPTDRVPRSLQEPHPQPLTHQYRSRGTKKALRRRGRCLRLPKRRNARLDPLSGERNRFVRYEQGPAAKPHARPAETARTLGWLIVRAARRTPSHPIPKRAPSLAATSSLCSAPTSRERSTE
jgi:hypothetical protein